MKILIWGTGKGSKNATNYILMHKEMQDTEIIAYADNNLEMWGIVFLSKKVVSPAEICKLEFDYVVIASVKYEIIKQQCIDDIGIPEYKIITPTELYRKEYARYQYKQRYQEEKDYKPVNNIGKVVVYTANIDNYDILEDPLVTDDDIEYICFTDDKFFISSVWKPIYVEKAENPVLLARKIKLFPHIYFPEYQISIWVDSKFTILGNMKEYVERYLKENSILCFPHFERECIYDEAVECIKQGKGDPIMIGGQIYQYYNEGFPKNMGLVESGCLVRKHNDNKVQELMQSWWNEIVKYSIRDQISFPYVCWKNKFKYDICDLSINGCRYLKLKGHNKDWGEDTN